MNGQWIGRYVGSNTGNAILELDEVGDHYEGKAYIFDNRADLPSTVAYVQVPKVVSSHKSEEVPLRPLDPISLDITEWRHIAARFPDVSFPETATVNWNFSKDTTEVSWVTNIGTHGTAILSKVDGDRPSELVPLDIKTWDGFRQYVQGLPSYKFMFRGQGNSTWRLRTSFHRTRRSDIVKFLQNDIAALHQHLSSLTPHFFDLTKPIEHGAFVSLVQHHGYPTPLLDWTYSPFIGAYFAFKDALENTSKVRVFILIATNGEATGSNYKKSHPRNCTFLFSMPSR